MSAMKVMERTSFKELDLANAPSNTAGGPITCEITDGPDFDELLEALKYAYSSRRTLIEMDIKYKVKGKTTEGKALLRISEIAHSDESGKSLILKGRLGDLNYISFEAAYDNLSHEGLMTIR